MNKSFVFLLIIIVISGCVQKEELNEIEEAPLFFTTMTHLEGDWNDDTNPIIFLQHVDKIRYAINLSSNYDGKLTFETEIPFANASIQNNINVLEEALNAEQGVGTHSDINSEGMNISELTNAFIERKLLVDELVGSDNNLGTSGGAGPVDYVKSASLAGFKYLSGGVGAHYLSMDLQNRPNDSWTDDYIYNEVFHDNAPVEFIKRIHPFLMNNASDFEHDEDGVILFNAGGIGRLDSMVEEGVENCPGMNCELTQEDVDLIINKINVAYDVRNKSMVSKVNVYIPLKLFTESNEPVLVYFFSKMKELEEEEIITWATQSEVYNYYMQWNSIE